MRTAIRTVVILGLVTVGITASAQAQVESPRTASSQIEEWRTDLRALSKELLSRQHRLFDSALRSRFELAVTDIERRLPTIKSFGEFTAELARLVALVGDGHTRLAEVSGPVALGWHRLPVRFGLFADGLFVQAATPEYRDIVGAKVTVLGTLPLEKALEAIAPFVPRDNEMTQASRLPGYLVFPEVLQAAGITPSPDRLQIQIERDGRQAAAVLAAVPADAALSWVDMRDTTAQTPLSLTNPTDRYWFRWLPDSQTIYVQYNSVADKPDDPLERFWDRVFAEVEKQHANRFVLDLRQNGGGDNRLNLTLVHHIIRSDRINQRGRLFVLIGRRTFSAAVALAVDLEKHTQAIFVGEPTGGHPNRYVDAGRLELPVSKLRVSYAPSHWPYSFMGDQRNWIPPALAVEATSSDYLLGRDPALALALQYEAEPTLADLLTDIGVSQGALRAIEELRRWRADPKRKYVETEWDVHLAGRRLVVRGRPQDGILLLQQNARDYPQSFRAFEDLGFAYAKAGDSHNARRSYERSLELNSSNLDAFDALKRLQERQ